MKFIRDMGDNCIEIFNANTRILFICDYYSRVTTISTNS